MTSAKQKWIQMWLKCSDSFVFTWSRVFGRTVVNLSAALYLGENPSQPTCLFPWRRSARPSLLRGSSVTDTAALFGSDQVTKPFKEPQQCPTPDNKSFLIAEEFSLSLPQCWAEHSPIPPRIHPDPSVSTEEPPHPGLRLRRRHFTVAVDPHRVLWAAQVNYSVPSTSDYHISAEAEEENTNIRVREAFIHITAVSLEWNVSKEETK